MQHIKEKGICPVCKMKLKKLNIMKNFTKKISVLAVSILTVLTGLNAQSDVTLNINHMLGSEQFTFNKEAVAPGNYKVNMSRMEYYISKIKLIHDGGQITALDSIYLLMNAGTSQAQNLGSLPITNLEEVKFMIGVDNLGNLNPNDPSNNTTNHADPSKWLSTHALAPRAPSMHWGWTSGYRFAAIEGKAGASLGFAYEIHALGDANYFEVSVPITKSATNGKLAIYIAADYLKSLDGIDASSGMIEHGETGDAIKYLKNFQTKVFSSSTDPGTTSIASIDENVQLKLLPNPSNGSFRVLFSSERALNYNLVISDLNGRQVYMEYIESGLGSINIDGVSPGIYVVSLLGDNNTVFTDRLIITP